MKKIVYIICVVFFLGCDSESASDCFQTSGNTVRKEIIVPDFKRILVNPNIELVIKQGENTSVLIETGNNLLNEVSVVLEGDRLVLSDTNDCSFFRDFNQTKIFVTAPDIIEIRSATQFDISSEGILRYSSLRLYSETFFEDTGNTTGTFHLDIENTALSVMSNSIASFFIEGTTEGLSINFPSGISRFDGTNLVVQRVGVFHRGTNKIIVNPQESIRGAIRSTGDVIALNKPPIVEVETFFTGQLIFQ